MGSGQSTAGSFSVDPNGNIVHHPTKQTNQSSTSSETINDNKQLSDNQGENQSNINELGTPTTSVEQSQSYLVPSPLDPSQADDHGFKKNELSLNEADEIVTRLKDKYKPSSRDMIGKQHSLFEEAERNLVQCYKTNKNSPLNCESVYKEYKNYVDSQRSQVLKKAAVKLPIFTTILVVLICILLHITTISCFGAVSIDLGSEWMKVGLVAPSVQMDIVLNAESQRKTPLAIAFSNNERFIGDPALDIASKYPERTFTNFLDLVGKTVDHESVKLYKSRFPYADIQSHEPNSTSIVLNHPEGLQFTPLELIAMMLQHAHDQVTNRLNEPAHDVVITVPPFFEVKERRVIEDAAKLVGLNVLRLTNSDSAFALSYGIFRHRDYYPETSNNKTTILFFDQGASTTSATLADFHLVEQFDEITGLSKNESLPTVTIRAQVYDRYLGGFDMQLRLRDYLVKTFARETKIDGNRIYKRGRSASKLLKEAGKVKKILSANTEHTVRVENVIDDKDFKHHITRQQFEEMNKDYLNDRIVQLLDRLFEIPGVSRNEKLESVIIVGGNTRTPKIQQILLDYFKLDTLGKSINADEGAALAALYQAASLGRGFRVKKFVLEEFGEERKRYDPIKAEAYLAYLATSTTEAPTTTTTTATTTTVEPGSTSTESPPASDLATDSSSTTTEAAADATTEMTTEAPTATTTTTTTATTTTAAPKTETQDPNSIYSPSELERIRDKLAYLREQDYLRLQRLSLRNSLESLISESRNSDNEELEKVITQTLLWLEDGPEEERHNLTLLAEKYNNIQTLFQPTQPPHIEL